MGVGFRAVGGTRRKVELAGEGYEFSVSFEVPTLPDLMTFRVESSQMQVGEAMVRFVARALRSWSLEIEPPEDFEGRVDLLQRMDTPAAFMALFNVISDAAQESRKN